MIAVRKEKWKKGTDIFGNHYHIFYSPPEGYDVDNKKNTLFCYFFAAFASSSH
jgi:hypothetical protein